jgi:transposase-like protein
MEAMFLEFYPNEEKLAQEFAKKASHKRVTMASLQQHFIRNRKRTAEVIYNYVLNWLRDFLNKETLNAEISEEKSGEMNEEDYK